MDTQTNTKLNFDDYQRMLAFAFLADITSGVTYKLGNGQNLAELQSAEEASLHSQMQKVVSNTTVARDMYLGAGWECWQNPWIDIQENPSKDLFARNTTAIFKNKDKNLVVVAVAGTNFVDNFDWFTEDLDVSNQVSWSTVMDGLTNGLSEIDHSKGVIANGTYTALKHTWFQGDKPTVGSKPALVETLSRVVEGMSKVELFVTGHSLGGAITPVLAQALLEKRADWDLGIETVNVYAFPFAGPTVGDGAYVNYVENLSNPKINLYSVYNSLDIVPHGWQLNMIDQMHDLFIGFLKADGTPDIPDAYTAQYGALVGWSLKWIRSKANEEVVDNDYKRWTNELIIEGDFPMDVKGFNTMAGAAQAALNKDVLVLDEHKDIKDAIKEITGHGVYDAQYLDFMGYFCKFLMMLKRQHITEYSAILWSGQFQSAFHDAVKAVKGGSSMKIDLVGGVDVLTALFTKVAAYKKQFVQEPA